MDITPLIAKEKKQINAYGNEGFLINEERIIGDIYITENHVQPIKLDLQNINDINFYKNLLTIIPQRTEILLVGVGEATKIINNEIKELFRERNINIEFMTSGAACRTYNVLLLEGRVVAAVIAAVK